MPAIRRFLGSFLLVAFVLAGPAEAQSSGTEDVDLINYAYASVFGNGLYVVAGQSVQVYRIPVSTTLRKPDDNDWGLTLRTPLTLGFYEFQVDDIFEGGFPDEIQTVSIVPGVEFEIPLSHRWTLRPSADFGAAKDLQGGQLAWVWSAGAGVYYRQPIRKATLTFGNTLLYIGSKINSVRSDAMAYWESGIDLTHPLWFKAGKRTAFWSIYTIGRFFFNDVEFARADDEPLTLDAEYEIGLGFSVKPEYSWWKLRAARFGIGYRYSVDNLTSIRITIGFPF